MDAEYRRGEIERMLSVVLNDCPEDPYLRMKAAQVIDLQERLYSQEKEALGLIEEFQAQCPHEAMKEVRKYNFDYCARVDGLSIGGLNVLLGHKCPACKIFKPRKEGLPYEVCYKCGGDMKFDHNEGYCGDNVHIYKCAICGHEHDTM